MASGDRDSGGDEPEGSRAAYKIILVGEPGVGKTTIFFRIKLDEFVDASRIRQHPVLQYSMKVGGTDVKVRIARRSKKSVVLHVDLCTLTSVRVDREYCTPHTLFNSE